MAELDVAGVDLDTATLLEFSKDLCPLQVDAHQGHLSDALEWGRQDLQDRALHDAVRNFSYVLQSDPCQLDALFLRGFCYSVMHENDGALRDFSEVIAQNSAFNRDVYILVALCFKRKGDRVTAARYLTRCLNKFPSFNKALVTRGQLYLQMRKYDKAMLDFRTILHRLPHEAAAHRGMGDALRGLGDFRDALRHYSKAIQCSLDAEPQDSSLLGSLDPLASLPSIGETATTSVAYELQLSRPALALLGEGTAHQSSSSRTKRQKAAVCEGYLRRALLYLNMGDLEKAAADLLEILQTDSEHGLAMLWYGITLIRLGRVVEACVFLQSASHHHEPTQNKSLALHAACLMVVGDGSGISETPQSGSRPRRDFRQAAQLLRKASTGDPSKSIQRTRAVAEAAVALDDGLAEKALQHLDRAARSLREHAADRAGEPVGTRVRTPRTAPVTPRDRQLQDTAEDRKLLYKQFAESRRPGGVSDDLARALDCGCFLDLVKVSRPLDLAVLHDEPVHGLVFALRTQAHLALGNWEDALHDSRDAMRLLPGEVASICNHHLAAAMVRSNKEDWEGALTCLAKALTVKSRPDLLLLRASLLCRVLPACSSGERFDAVAEELLRCLDVVITDGDHQIRLRGRFMRAAILLALRRYEASLIDVEVCAEEEFPANAMEGHALRARILAGMGRYSEAVKLVSDVLTTDETEEMLMLRARCLLMQGDMDGGCEDARQALTIAPNDASLLVGVGELYLSQGLAQQALYTFKVARKLGGDQNPALWILSGLSHLSQASLQPCIDSLNAAICQNPCHREAFFVRDAVQGISWAEQGRFEQAVKRFTKLLCTPLPAPPSGPGVPRGTALIRLPMPQNFELVLYRGACQMYLDRPDLALKDFILAKEMCEELYIQVCSGAALQHLEELPEMTDAGQAHFSDCMRYNCCLAYIMQGEFVSALQAARQIWFLCGLCHLALESFEEAWEAFKQSYAKDPDSVDDFLRRHNHDLGSTFTYRAPPGKPLSKSAPRPRQPKPTVRAQGQAAANSPPVQLPVSFVKPSPFCDQFPGKAIKVQDAWLIAQPWFRQPFVPKPSIAPAPDPSVVLAAFSPLTTLFSPEPQA
mmetsp:Transcript_88334/g.202006  ORF Transcript_88334/g.202006 Transcript_88334/m.202006 type:complete len:1102 (-) Transcript_88334:87-3392(-)